MSKFQRVWTSGSPFLLLVLVLSCQPATNAPESPPVAKYGQELLTREEMRTLLPPGLTPEDSLEQSSQFIQNWLKQQAIVEATRELVPEAEVNIRYQTAAHRRSLATHYFADYLTQNLDERDISPAEILQYYQRHQDKFTATDNYYAFFHVVLADRPPGEQVARMRSNDPADIAALKTWARKEAVTFKLDSTFVPEKALASILEGTYLRPQSLRPDRTQTFRNISEDTEYHNMLKLISRISEGEQMPLSLCKAQITEILLNQKRHMLLEQEKARRLQKAKSEGKAKVF